MLSQLLSRILILVLGTLYPAYSSYKTVRTKNVREYVKWMMYWVVFAFFTTAETFGDIFLSWLPLYYEVKIIFLLWLLAPATKGSSILYRKFVHPYLSKNEKDIDGYIERASQSGVGLLRQAGQRGFQAVASGVAQSNVISMGQTYLQQQLQQMQIVPPGEAGAAAVPAQVPHNQQEELLLKQQMAPQQQGTQPQQQPFQQQQQHEVHGSEVSSAQGDVSVAAYVSQPARTQVSAYDEPPPYNTVTTRQEIKSEPRLDDGAIEPGAFVPLTPPLNRSRPAAGSAAQGSSAAQAASHAAAGTRRTTKAAGRTTTAVTKPRSRTAQNARK